MDERSARELRERLEKLKQQEKRGPDQRPHHAEERRDTEEGHERPAERSLLDNRYVFLGLVAVILITAVYLRTGMLKYTGFFEPDGFFHYSIISQAVANGYVVPLTSIYSGFPAHNYVSEPTGLYYVTIVPYILLQYLGVSYYAIERLVPILFGLLDCIGAYLLVRQLLRSRVAGLLGMFFIAISSGDIARTAGLVYRGDGFVTIFAIAALLLFIAAVRQERRHTTYICAALSGISLDVALVVWGGAPFAVVVYIVALIMVLLYGFMKANARVLRAVIALSLGLLLTYAVERLLIAVNVLRYVPSLGSYHFFIFYIPVLFGSLLAYYITERRDTRFFAIAHTWQRRAGFVMVLALVVVAVVLAGFYGYISTLSKAAIGTGSLGTTIQELQPPTLAFVWSSFSYQLVLAPFGVVMFLAIRKRLHGHERLGSATMHASIAFLVLVSYFMATTYLQAGAIRYNSLVSVPIAVFAAYGVYALSSLLYRKGAALPVLALIALFCLAFVVGLYVIHTAIDAAIAAYVVYFVSSMVYVFAVERQQRKVLSFAFFLVIGMFTAMVLLNSFQTYIQSFSSAQADNINPQFLQAVQWIRNNTPSNATFIDVWPDGSVIEGWGHRQSLMDSVNGQNNAYIYNISRFLFNTTPEPNYLAHAAHHPDYILARQFWFAELGGIATEGNVTNVSAYGYDIFSSLHISRASNSTVYTFNTSSYPYYSAELLVTPGANGTSSFAAYLISPLQHGSVQMKDVLFVNQSTGAYSEAVSGAPGAINYTMMIDFVGTTITGGALLGPKMPQSNLFKLLVLCNSAQCPYNDNTNVTLQLVYSNNDTRIFKINYP